MKEAYFTLENIDTRAREYLDTLDYKHKFTLNPERSALIVTDMQEFFLNEKSHAFVPSSKAIISRVNELVCAYRKRGLAVIFTQHMDSTHNAGLMDKWWRDVLTENNPLSQIGPDFDLNNLEVVKKSQYDAFFNTDLEKILKAKNVSQIVITGVMTHLCCETTARSGFIRGFEPFFAVDGTATYREEYHLSSLKNLSHGFAVPVLTGQVMEVLNEG